MHGQSDNLLPEIESISPLGARTLPKNDKFKDYTRYAEHCLNMVTGTADQELRCI
jgi:hypothetical protein